MPAHPVAVSAGVLAVSVAAAAAIAVYESPELQRFAADLRRRIAIALHSLGDSITPQERENLFNRPEDAEGFLRSRGMLGPEGEPGVDADEETRRRQREELLYWNAMLDKSKDDGAGSVEDEKPKMTGRLRGPSFDDFMSPDAAAAAEKGSFVFNSGTQAQESRGELRRRGQNQDAVLESSGAAQYSHYSNPFADEYGIDSKLAFESSPEEPKEAASDIYSATDLGREDASQTLAPSSPRAGATTPTPQMVESPLLDLSHSAHQTHEPAQLSEREPGPFEFQTAGQEDPYTSIQAWAHTSQPGFFSPLPETPADSMSEPELISEGQWTPTDSISVVDANEDAVHEARSARSDDGTQGTRDVEVMSDDVSIMTPTSWSDVGSVVSDMDAGPVHA